MSKTTYQMPATLQRDVEQSALDFANEVVSIVQRAITDYAQQFAVKPSAGAPRKASAPARAAAPAKPRGRGPARKEDSALEGSLIALLKKNKDGMSAEKINAALGTKTADIGPALKKLLEGGKVNRSGQARGTRYSAA